MDKKLRSNKLKADVVGDYFFFLRQEIKIPIPMLKNRETDEWTEVHSVLSSLFVSWNECRYNEK